MDEEHHVIFLIFAPVLKMSSSCVCKLTDTEEASEGEMPKTTEYTEIKEQ